MQCSRNWLLQSSIPTGFFSWEWVFSKNFEFFPIPGVQAYKKNIFVRSDLCRHTNMKSLKNRLTDLRAWSKHLLNKDTNMKLTRCNPKAISRYCDGELFVDQIDRLRAHLETCRSCRQVMDDYKSVSRMAAEEIIHRFPLETGLNLEYRIMNQLKSGSIEQEHYIWVLIY